MALSCTAERKAPTPVTVILLTLLLPWVKYREVGEASTVKVLDEGLIVRGRVVDSVRLL